MRRMRGITTHPLSDEFRQAWGTFERFLLVIPREINSPMMKTISN